MTSYAIIKDRGRQYQVSIGDVLDIDLMADVKQQAEITFKDVLLTSDGQGQVRVGEPVVSGASVKASVVEPLVRGEKIDVVHFRAKKDSSDKNGHRQPFTRIKIDTIQAGN